jgi:hypothetical protein
MRLSCLVDATLSIIDSFNFAREMTIPDAYKKVPIMFQAQTRGRCQLSYIADLRNSDRAAQSFLITTALKGGKSSRSAVMTLSKVWETYTSSLLFGIAEYKYDLAPLPPKFGGNYSLKSPSFGGFRGQTKTLSIAIHTLIQQRLLFYCAGITLSIVSRVPSSFTVQTS